MERDTQYAGVELIQPLIVFRSWLLLVSVVFAVAVLLFKITSPTEYRASVVLSPIASNNRISDRLGQLSSLAGLAGINISGKNEDVSDFDNFTYLVTSLELAAWQLQHRSVLGLLFKDWDDKAKTWRPRSFPKSMLVLLMNDRQPPTPHDVQRLLGTHLSISDIPSVGTKSEPTGLIRLSYTDRDPATATQMLQYVVDDANEILRERAAVRATIQANYLRDQLGKVTVQEYRETLEALLSQQEQKLMLTNSHLPYAATPLSDIKLPAERVPKRTLLMSSLGGAVGFSFSYFFVVLLFNTGYLRPGFTDYQETPRVPVFSTIYEWLLSIHPMTSRSRSMPASGVPEKLEHET